MSEILLSCVALALAYFLSSASREAAARALLILELSVLALGAVLRRPENR